MSIPLTYPNGLRRHYDHTVLLPTPSRLSLYLSTASGGITIIRSYPLPSVLSTLTLTLTLSSLLTLRLYGLRLMLSSLPTLRVYGLRLTFSSLPTLRLYGLRFYFGPATLINPPLLLSTYLLYIAYGAP